jgi:predicted transcriptional regulator
MKGRNDERKEWHTGELTELLNEYYDGSFTRMVCDYIRISGLSAKEVEEVQEVLKKEKGA